MMPQEEPLKSDDSENSEPPSRSLLLFIGRNARGCWVVRDQSGKRSGLFVSRAEAFRFCMFETDHRPRAIIMVPGLLELDMRGSKKVAANQETGTLNVPHGARELSAGNIATLENWFGAKGKF